MKRQDYIKDHAVILKRLCDKRDKLNVESMKTGLTKKRYQAIVADLNFTCMHIAQEEERILFALGKLRPEEEQASKFTKELEENCKTSNSTSHEHTIPHYDDIPGTPGYGRVGGHPERTHYGQRQKASDA